jgi:hypothetical protein
MRAHAHKIAGCIEGANNEAALVQRVDELAASTHRRFAEGGERVNQRMVRLEGELQVAFDTLRAMIGGAAQGAGPTQPMMPTQSPMIPQSPEPPPPPTSMLPMPNTPGTEFFAVQTPIEPNMFDASRPNNLAGRTGQVPAAMRSPLMRDPTMSPPQQQPQSGDFEGPGRRHWLDGRPLAHCDAQSDAANPCSIGQNVWALDKTRIQAQSIMLDRRILREHRLSQVRLSMGNSRGNNISIMLDPRSIIIPIAKVDSTRTLS